MALDRELLTGGGVLLEVALVIPCILAKSARDRPVGCSGVILESPNGLKAKFVAVVVTGLLEVGGRGLDCELCFMVDSLRCC